MLKKYVVTLWLVVNAFRDSHLEKPELSSVDFILEAESEMIAIRKLRVAINPNFVYSNGNPRANRRTLL